MKRLRVAHIADALGRPFDTWAREHGFSEDVAAKAVERYMKGRNIIGYKQQIVLRELYRELGFTLHPTQDLPPAAVLAALVRERIGGCHDG